MKKILVRLSALVALLLPVSASAANGGASLYIYCGGLPGCGSGFSDTFANSTFNVLFTRLPLYIYGLGVLFIMVGGAYMVMSAGNDERVTKGKNTIIWSIIGIFVTSFTFTLIGFVQQAANDIKNGSGPDVVMSAITTGSGSIATLLYVALSGVAIYCGMRMVLSLGKEDEFTKARTGLVYAAIGAIIITLANTIYLAFVSL